MYIPWKTAKLPHLLTSSLNAIETTVYKKSTKRFPIPSIASKNTKSMQRL